MGPDLEFDSVGWQRFALSFCRRRCPTLSEQELIGAAESFLGYLKAVRQMQLRKAADGTLDQWYAAVKAEEAEQERHHLLIKFVDLLFYRAEEKRIELAGHAVEP